MANNIYLAGTVAAMQLSLSDAENSDKTLNESRAGLGFQGLIGKEWWVSEDWGLGVAGEVMAATMKDESTDLDGPDLRRCCSRRRTTEGQADAGAAR